ncbi:MAG: phage major capsid protein [Sphaerobacter sp.]|nr:phage major capsid protein [Sphaerobacter sp.]
MQTVLELRRQRAALVEQARAILETAERENRDLSGEEREKWDRIMADVDALKERIDRMEALAAHEEDLRRLTSAPERPEPGHAGRPTQDEEREAFRAWLRYGMAGLTPEQRAVMQRRYAELPPEQRALGEATGAAGGFLVPEQFQAQIETAMQAYGGIRQTRVTVVPTTNGDPMPWPTANDVAEAGELLAEGTAVAEADPSYGQVTVGAYTFSSKLVRVSVQLLQDSAIDIEAWLAQRLGERLARGTSRYFTTGTGSGQPQGVVTAAHVGHTAATTNAITYDDLVQLQASLDAAYDTNAQWMLSKPALVAIKQLKDNQGRPLWLPGLAMREPDTILGKPYVVSAEMDGLVANGKPVIYGDFSKFLIRDVRGVTLLRLQERYAEYLQVGFLAFSRHDSRLLDAGTHPIVAFQMAAA